MRESILERCEAQKLQKTLTADNTGVACLKSKRKMAPGDCCYALRSTLFPAFDLTAYLVLGGWSKSFCALVFLRFNKLFSVACIQFLFAKYNLIYLQITIKFEI